MLNPTCPYNPVGFDTLNIFSTIMPYIAELFARSYDRVTT